MSQNDNGRIEDFIKDLGEAELLYLNRLIVERLKLISQAKSTQAMSQFNIGEMVQFENEAGDTITGRIMKLNKKTVSLVTHDNHRWKVAPIFLRSAKRE